MNIMQTPSAEAENPAVENTNSPCLSDICVGAHPNIEGNKICLVRIEQVIPEGIFDPDDFLLGDELPEPNTPERRKYDEANALFIAAEKQARKNCDAVSSYLLGVVGGGSEIDCPGLPEEGGGHDYALMTFAPEVEDEAINKLFGAFRAWGGARVVANVMIIGRHQLSISDVRAAAYIHSSWLDGIPREEESDGEWISRIATAPERVRRATEKLIVSNGDPAFASTLGIQQFMANTNPVSFLVEGLVPFGEVSLLVGEKKIGKTTLITELACSVATGGKAWAGFNLRYRSEGRGIVLFVSGEDGTSILHSRLQKAEPNGPVDLFSFLNVHNAQQLKAALAGCEDKRVSLLVVDPLRKYLSGNEDDSGAVSEFFGLLEKFASRTGAAVIATHHVGKGRAISSLRDVISGARGSSVITDRPRVALGLYRHADGTSRLGIATMHAGAQSMHNIPQAHSMLVGERVLRFDEATQRHLAVDGAGSQAGEAPDATASVLSAIRRLVGEGHRVTRSGKHELFQQKPPEVAAMSRATVRKAVSGLVDAGALVIEEGQVRLGH